MLKDTLSKFFKLDSLIGNLTGLVETRVELLKVEVKEEVAKGLAKAVAWLIISFLSVLFIVFVSIGLAFLIGQRLGVANGFMIISGVYLLVGLILFLARNKVVSGLEDSFMLMLRKKKEPKEEYEARNGQP